ncbi:hypothetical protein GCM10011352_39800 [Marinobacterium zhoushanense]|uniref:DUF748 domain-containing protein n=1 Tax=Marinobacterium zhoushanense TaxID=1679163 RepID=A0ABQ1KXH0_9GAMM|nr:hypothetical protein GCM10011352_39800 [Marinobacterium zhoushanense]
MLLVVLVLFTTPYIVRDQLVIWLHKQGVDDARLDTLDVNYLSGRVQVRGLRAVREGYYPLQLDRLQLTLDYGSLFQRQVRVTSLDLQGLRGGVAVRDSEQWLGPINLTQLASGSTPEEPVVDDGEASRWSFGLDNLQLNGIDWRLALEQQEHRLELDNLWLGAIYLWEPQIETTLSLSGRINGAPFALDSTSVPLPAQKHGKLKLSIDQLQLKPILGDLVPQLDATLSTDLSLSAQLDGPRISLLPEGSISIGGLLWRDAELNFSSERIEWQGAATIGLDTLRPDSIEINGKLNLPKGIALGQSAQELRVQQLGWQGDLVLSMPEQSAMTLALDGALGTGGLDFIQQGEPGLNLSLAQADWRGNTRLSLAQGEQAAIDLSGQNALRLDVLVLTQGDNLDLQLDRLDLDTALSSQALQRWQLENTRVALGPLTLRQGEALELSLSSLEGELGARYDLTSSQLGLQAPGITAGATNVRVAQKPLAALESLKLAQLELALPLKVGLSGAQFQGLELARTERDEPLLALAGLGVQRLMLDQQQLQIDRVDLSGLDGVLTLNEQMVPVDIQALQQQLEALGGASGQGQPAAEDPATAAEQGEAFRIRIDELVLAGDSQLRFTDRSTKPVFSALLAIDRANINAIDTAGDAQSEFALSAQVNRFAKLTAEGAVNLIGSPRSGHWSAQLVGMDLPSLSPYSIKYTGYFLKNGQLNLKLDGALEQDQLDGSNHIRLNRLEVDPVDQAQVGKFQQQISMPLGTAVAVLQDDDDNIDLDVPVSGSLDDPEFDYQSIIKRIAGKGVKQGVMSYLLQAMQPYGALISLAQSAIEASQTGAFIRLEPVLFEPGSEMPKGDVDGYLAKLTELMNARDGLRLNLCGISVAEDRSVLDKALAEENAKRDKPLEAEVLAAELDSRLQQLANARAELLKQRLQDDVSADRLFLCYAQVDKEGLPRVEPAL